MQSEITFDNFQAGWLADVIEGHPSTTELGHRFAFKLITQWLDIGQDAADQDAVDLMYCDGAGDGGVDIAYLQRGEESGGDDRRRPRTWRHLVSRAEQVRPCLPG